MCRAYKEAKQVYMNTMEELRIEQEHVVPHFIGVPVFIVFVFVGIIRGAISRALRYFHCRKN